MKQAMHNAPAVKLMSEGLLPANTISFSIGVDAETNEITNRTTAIRVKAEWFVTPKQWARMLEIMHEGIWISELEEGASLG